MAGGAIESGHALCGSTESRTKNGAEGGETKRLDLGRDVADRRRESLHSPEPEGLSGGKTDLGEEYQTESGGGQEEEVGGGGDSRTWRSISCCEGDDGVGTGGLGR